MPINEYDELISDNQDKPINEYDRLLNEHDELSSQELRKSVLGAVDKNPDAHANVINLSEKTGLPSETVERNLSEIQKQVKFEETDYDALLESNPVLARHLSDRDFSAVAHDDIDNLSFWEKTKDVTRAVPGGLIDAFGAGLRGLAEINDAVGRSVVRGFRSLSPEIDSAYQNYLDVINEPGTNKNITDTIIDYSPSSLARKSGDAYGDLGEAVNPDPERQTLATDIANGIGQITGQIAVSLVNPGVGLSFLFGQGADQQATRAEEAGATQEERDQAILIGSAVTGVTEKIGLDKLLERLPPQIENAVARNLLDIGIAGGIEAVQETVEGIMHNLIALGIYDDDAQLIEGLEREAMAAGGAGAIFRAFINVITPGRLSGTEYKQQQSQKGISNKEFLDSVGNSSKESKLRERSPAKYQKMVADSLRNSSVENVGIPADRLTEFFQTNPDAFDDFNDNVENFEENLHQANLLGEDVSIPTDVLATYIASKEYYDSLSQDIRLSSDSMTAFESETFTAESSDQLLRDYQEFADQIAETAEGQVSGDLVFNDVVEQLVAAGQPQDIAEKNALVHKAFFETMAQRTGVDAFSLYQGQNLKIRSERVRDPLDDVIDLVRTGKGPTEFEAFGPTLTEFLRERGGITDIGGELAARDLGKTEAFQKSLIQEEGLAPDEAIQVAREAGFIPEAEDVTADDFTGNELLELLDQEAAGQRLFAEQFTDQEAADLRAQLENIENLINQAGLDVTEMTNQEVKDFLDGLTGTEFEQAGDIESDAFKNWFGDSKVVDEAGNPQVVFHGTSEEFEAFDPEKAIGGQFWFTTDKDAIERGEVGAAGRGVIVEVYLSLKNPAGWKEYENLTLDELIARGYDGLALPDPDGEITYVAFEPAQIKSTEAVEFDPDDPRILFQQEEIEQAKQFVDSLSDIENLPAILRAQEPELDVGAIDEDIEPAVFKFQAFQEEVSAEDVSDLQNRMQEKEGIKTVLLSLTDDRTIKISSIIVDKDKRKQGIGTDVMNEIISFADNNGLDIVLTPAQKDDFQGTTSRARLVKFYKRFGFVENKGRNKDFTISESMYREPAGLLQEVADTESPEFISWAGTDDPVIESEDINDTDFTGKGPFVVRVFHGTTHDFTEFDATRGNFEGQFGAVNYFTSSEQDATDNYAGEGPDLTNRIDQRTEQLAYKLEEQFEEIGRKEVLESLNRSTGRLEFISAKIAEMDNHDAADYAASALARYELAGGADQTLELYVKLENPFIVGGETQWIEFIDNDEVNDKAIQEVADNNDITVEEVNENIEDYEEQIDEAKWDIEQDIFAEHPLVEAINTVADRHDFDASELASQVYDLGSEALSDSIEKLMRESESTMYAEGPEGEFLGSHLVGEVIEELGYDSIILKNAEDRFANMNIESGTSHIHIFDSGKSNIKSVRNVGTFDPETADIFLQEEKAKKKKRGRIIFTTEGAIIDLFKDANLSTFLHESGHLFLNAFSAVADQPNAPQQIKDDMQSVLDWLDIESIDMLDPNNNGEAAIAAQEKWARGFEAYLREGKAPSEQLQSAFQRFKSWLINIYRSIKNLNVDINNDIREVMDRMLATDDEIIKAQSRNNIRSVFATTEESGLTEEQTEEVNQTNTDALESAKEKLLVKLLKQITREKKQWWKDEKKSTREQVESEFHQRKDYKAKSWLQTGSLPDGTELGIEHIKLSRADLVAMYGNEPGALWRKLPFGKNSVWQKDGGLHPDVVAGMFGFTSGDEMVQDIVAAGNMKTQVNEETQRRMLDKHGDILNDGTIEAEADEAMHNVDSVESMLSDINALNKKTGRGKSPKQVFRNIAKQIIGEKKAVDIKPAQILQNERRVTDRLLKAIEAGDDDLALQLANQRLINHFMYMEARDSKTRVETIQKYMSGIVRRKYNPKQVDPDYINQLKLLASMYDFRKGKVEDVRKAQEQVVRLVDWIKAQQDSEVPIYIPELISPDLARVSAMIDNAKQEGVPVSDIIQNVRIKSYKDMTLGELEDVYNTARHLRHIGGKNSEQAREELRELAQSLADSINEHGGEGVEEITDKDWFDKAKEISLRFSFDQIKLLSDIRLFDGFEDFGPMFRSIYQQVVDGTNKRIEIDLNAAERIAEIFKPMEKQLSPKNDIRTFRKSEDIGDWSLSLRERVMLAMYWGSPESREAILEGHQVTEADVQKMLDTLTDEQLDFVEQIWAFNESMWPELSRIETSINGVPPVKVDHVPFEAGGRQMAGGYFRLYYEWSVKDKFKIDMHDEANKMMHSNRVTQSKTGAVISRVGSGGRKVKLDPDSFFRAIEDNLQFIAFAESSREVSKLAQHPVVAQAIVDKYGRDRYQSFIDSLDGVFAGDVANNNPVNKMLRGVRTNLTFGYLALSVRNFVQQPIALTNAMGRIGEKETLKAIMDVYMHPKKYWSFIKDKSVFMAQRNKFVNREAAEQLASIKGSGGLGWKPKWAFVFQTMGDAFATYPAWLAAYRQGIEKFSKPGVSEEELEKMAVTYADELTASTVGSGLSKDLAPLFQGAGSVAREVGSETVKQLTFMGSFFNMQYNLYYEAWKRADFTSGKSSLDFAREMAWYAVVPGILSALVVGDGPDDEDDEGLWEWAIKATAEFGFSSSMFWRNMVSTLKGFEPSIPAFQFFKGVGRAGEIAVDVATEPDELDAETIAKLIRSFEPMVALPGGGQAARTLEYLDSYNQGDEGEFSLHGMLIEGKER